MNFYTILFGFLILSLTGCDSTPSDDLILTLLQSQHADKNLHTFSTIKNAEKLNGFSESDNRYIADMTYDLEFTMGVNELEKETERQYREAIKSKGRLSSREKMSIKYSIVKEWMPLLKDHRKFNKGDIVSKVVKVNLIKKEKGWEIDSVQS